MIFVSVRFHSLRVLRRGRGRGDEGKGVFFFPLKGCGIPIMDVSSDGVLGLLWNAAHGKLYRKNCRYGVVRACRADEYFSDFIVLA